MADISDKRIAILATDGFEQSELMVPKQRLEEAGAMVDVYRSKRARSGGGKTETGASQSRSIAPSMR